MNPYYRYHRNLNGQCPICIKKAVLYTMVTIPEGYFRTMCCSMCCKVIEYIYEKSRRQEYDYYEGNVNKKYISKVLSVAFSNDSKSDEIHIDKNLYYHPNSRLYGSDPMLL